MRKEVYTTGELGAILRISRAAVAHAIDRGDMPGFRVPLSRLRRVTHKQLLRWLEAHPEFGFALEEIGEAPNQENGHGEEEGR